MALFASSAGAADECPCDADDAACRSARDVVSNTPDIGDLSPEQSAALARAFEELRRIARSSPAEGPTNPRLYSYLANAANRLGDFVSAAAYALRALELQTGAESAKRCEIDDGRARTLQLIAMNAPKKTLSVRLEIEPHEARARARVRARLLEGKPADKPLEYAPGMLSSQDYVFNLGAQELIVEADGYEPAQQTVTIAVGARLRLTLKALPERDVVAPAPLARPPVTTVPPSTVPAGISHSRYVWGGVVGVGVLGGTVSALLMVDAIRDFNAKNDELKGMCPGNDCGPDTEVARYRSLQDEARDDRTRARIWGIAGGAFVIGAGAYSIWRLLDAPATASRTASRIHIEAWPGPAGFRGGVRMSW